MLVGVLPSGEPRGLNRWSGQVALSPAPWCYWTSRYNGNRNDEERTVYGGDQPSGYIEDLRKRRGGICQQLHPCWGRKELLNWFIRYSYWQCCFFHHCNHVAAVGMLAICRALSFVAPFLCAALVYFSTLPPTALCLPCTACCLNMWLCISAVLRAERACLSLCISADTSRSSGSLRSGFTVHY